MAKPRVYELAKVLNVDSKTVLEKLKDMGEFVKSASSTIEPPVARRLKAEFAKDNAKGDSKPASSAQKPAAKPVQQRRPAAPSAPASTSSSAPTPAAPARQASPASAHQQAPTPGAPTPRPQGGARTGMPTPGRHGQHDNRENGRDNREGRENGRQSRPNDRRNNDRRNNQGHPNNGQPGQHQNNRGNASAPRPHAQGGAGANGGNAASNAIPRPHAQGPRPGNNPFSRKQGMHTPTPGDIPRPHPMARPTADSGRGGRPGRPGQGQGQGRGFRGGRPGQGGQGGPRPGQWGHNRPGQGGGSQGAGQGGARGGFRGGQGGGNNFQGGGAPSNGPARGGGRGGRGGAAGAFGRQGGKSSKARKNRLAKRHEYEELKAPTIGGVRIPNGNGQTIRLRQGASLADLAEKINVNQAALVTVLFHLGQMATATQSLDEETFQILGGEIGWNIQLVSAEEEDKELLQQFDINLDEEELQDDEDLKPRPPVVTVMGHVDHGKTRLLDTIRKTNVIAREAGGITQRIGAYQVTVNLEGEPRKITFLDTPGHEAFTAMRARGAVATVLVQQGTLHVGDAIVAGTSYGRVRAMLDENGQPMEAAGPSTPVQVLGLTSVPTAGDLFLVASDDRAARQIAEKRQATERAAQLAKRRKVVSLEDFKKKFAESEIDMLNIVIKGDSSGSVEALEDSLMKIEVSDEVGIQVIHRGVGAITQNDVNLATVDKAVIIGFNVRPNRQVADLAEREGVEIKYYSVIYRAIEDIEASLKGMLKPEYEEVVTSHSEIREIFRSSKFGNIAGVMVQDGEVKRGTKCRILRNGVATVHDLEISSLRRFKVDVQSVKEGYEAGINLGTFNDIELGDIIETFEMQEVERK